MVPKSAEKRSISSLAHISIATLRASNIIQHAAVGYPDTPAGTVEDNTYQSPSARHAGVPFTGIMAAEATLQAVTKARPVLGLDLGRELGRLARRAADMRE